MLLDIPTSTVTVRGPASIRGKVTFDDGFILTKEGELIIPGDDWEGEP